MNVDNLGVNNVDRESSCQAREHVVATTTTTLITNKQVVKLLYPKNERKTQKNRI